MRHQNELAEVFLLRKFHKETLIKKLNEYLANKPNSDKVEFLNELDIKSELLEQIKTEQLKFQELKKELESLQADEAEKSEKLQTQIDEKDEQIRKLIDECGNYELVPSDITGIEYSHVITESCQHCGCCGDYNCHDVQKGEIQNCSNCGSLTCKYCLQGGTLCPNCKESQVRQEAVVAAK